MPACGEKSPTLNSKAVSVATVVGSLKRRGPALPGINKESRAIFRLAAYANAGDDSHESSGIRVKVERRQTRQDLDCANIGEGAVPLTGQHQPDCG